MRVLIAAALVAFCGLAYSQQAPDPVEQASGHAQKSKKNQSNSTPQQTITFALPASVNNVVTGQLTVEASERYYEAHKEHTNWAELSIAVLTAALVAVTAWLAWVTKGLFVQTRDIAQDSKNALQINKDAYVAANRAWIRADVKLISQLVHQTNGALECDVEIILVNVGTSPALHVSQQSHFGSGYIRAPADKQKEMAETGKQLFGLNGPKGITLFPNEKSPVYHMKFSIAPVDMAELLKNRNMPTIQATLFVAINIDYQLAFGGHRQTGYVFDYRINTHGQHWLIPSFFGSGNTT